MRGTPRERGRHREEPNIPCGATGYEFSSTPRKPRFFCGRWECEPCRKWNIQKYQKIIKGAGLAAIVFVSQRPPVITRKDRNDFTNFLRKIEKPFFWFKSDKQLILVTKYRHSDADQKPLYHVTDKLLPEVLNEPWAWWAGNRFGKSRKEQVEEDIDVDNADTEDAQDVQGAQGVEDAEDLEFKEPFVNIRYAKWKKYNDPAGETAFNEFKELNLCNDFAIYKFLKKYQNKIKLFEYGRELIEYFESSCSCKVSAAGI